jgi:hypothetical protein
MKVGGVNIGTVAKAIYSGLIAGLSALGGYLTNNTSLGQITAGQWVFVALAALISAGGVYGISNAAPKQAA